MRRTVYLTVALVILALVPACARLQTPIAAEQRQNVIPMTASDFKFQPNNIETSAGNTIKFQIQNTSGASHNFTIKDPDGKTLQNVDIPVKKSVEVDVTFEKPGTYKFYCGKAGHSELGMQGQVVARGR